MSPLRQSTILSALARTRTQAPRIHQFRQYATARSAVHSQADWGYQWKRVGGSAMMYFPVVAVVMFWPYAVEPIVDYVEERW